MIVGFQTSVLFFLQMSSCSWSGDHERSGESVVRSYNKPADRFTTYTWGITDYDKKCLIHFLKRGVGSGRSERSISNVFFGILRNCGTYSRLRLPDMPRNRDYKLRSFLIRNDNYGVFTTFYETVFK